MHKYWSWARKGFRLSHWTHMCFRSKWLAFKLQLFCFLTVSIGQLSYFIKLHFPHLYAKITMMPTLQWCTYYNLQWVLIGIMYEKGLAKCLALIKMWALGGYSLVQLDCTHKEELREGKSKNITETRVYRINQCTTRLSLKLERIIKYLLSGEVLCFGKINRSVVYRIFWTLELQK